ncbi:glycosyltransferase [Candidatus Nitrososphaera evergladensis]|uniref:glycosyltransferase n=1 Tax=Candidatus Nitrososphaera evergladensis TaxID=1459637 RepID=UPI00130E04E1|nr:glycosyltransferase [Candidatus Nitrososphaera evergladensis]
MSQPKFSNNNKKVAIIFCTKNSARTIENAIANVKQSPYAPSIIVIDGFSNDNTIELAKKAGATIAIEQPERKFPGKGIAMKAGLQEAEKMGAHIALFLDADIKNLTSEWVDALVEPVVERGYDMTRGFYERHPKDAAVTKLIARPMISVFFPELSGFEQPLSGEVCANIRVWTDLLKRNPPDGWGIDVWFLIEVAVLGHKVKEIFLGKKEHASFDAYREDVGKLSKMSEQVLFTIMQEAVKYNRLDAYRGVST